MCCNNSNQEFVEFEALDHKYYTKYRIKRHLVLLITLIMNKFTSIVIPTYF